MYHSGQQKNRKNEKKLTYTDNVVLCRLNLMQKGLPQEKIDMLENNIRAIINNVFDDLEHGK